MYAEALRDPETLLDVAQPGGECDAMLSVALDAYAQTTGRELVFQSPVRYSEPSGAPWEEETVAARYPRLAAKFAPYLQ